MSEAKIIHFPVDKRMPTRVAEEKLGNVVIYRYPPVEKMNLTRQEWLQKWMLKRSVLYGWQSVKEGLVRSFKTGRVRHLVERVVANADDARPRLELCCGMDTYPVFNWQSNEAVSVTPVIILSIEQTSYFRICERCLARQGGGRW